MVYARRAPGGCGGEGELTSAGSAGGRPSNRFGNSSGNKLTSASGPTRLIDDDDDDGVGVYGVKTRASFIHINNVYIYKYIILVFSKTVQQAAAPGD